MDGQATKGILRFFGDVPDPRASNVVHRLHDILVIAICAVICGADGWVDVEQFGRSKLAWLKTFLDLPHGVPSHDTFGRVFAALDPDAFERCFLAWTSSLRGGGGGGGGGGGAGTRLVAFDGKSVRRSFAHAWDRSGMAHLVGAFVADDRLAFAQRAADGGKSGELAAIRGLIDLLDLSDAVVSVDALGCQRDIAAAIVAKDADYMLAVKANQPELHRKVKALLDEAILEGFAGLRHGRAESVEGDHGRVESRRVWVTDEVRHLGPDLLDAWPALASVAVVESQREVLGGGGGGGMTRSRRYYISSVEGVDACRMAELVRGHWSIENSLHWQLDVSFREDERRVRIGHAAENFSRLCRLALNLLRADTTAKIGIKAKRLKAGWDEPYLLRLLTG